MACRRRRKKIYPVTQSQSDPSLSIHNSAVETHRPRSAGNRIPFYPYHADDDAPILYLHRIIRKTRFSYCMIVKDPITTARYFCKEVCSKPGKKTFDAEMKVYLSCQGVPNLAVPEFYAAYSRTVGKHRYKSLIMKYYPNGSVLDVLESSDNFISCLTPDSYLQWIRQFMRKLLTTIKVLHHVEIIHRDIKCSNILLDENYMPILIDYGIASVGGESLFDDEYGTPIYMPPEGTTSYEGDIWAIGVVLYIITFKHIPFDVDGPDPFDVNYPARLNPDIHKLLEAIFVPKEVRPTANDLLQTASLFAT